MKSNKKSGQIGYAVTPFATTRNWGHMMVFRDAELAQKFADADPLYREIVEMKLIPLPKRKNK